MEGKRLGGLRTGKAKGAEPWVPRIGLKASEHLVSATSGARRNRVFCRGLLHFPG
jgi:hypothetical protein